MENIAAFNSKFFGANSHHIVDLTTLLQNATLIDQQWEQAWTKLDTLIHNTSDTINNTCTTTPLPILTQRTTQQGGYLPRKLQKQWKQHLATYHLTRKAIYLAQHIPNWRAHPLILRLQFHPYVQIPILPPIPQPLDPWIQQLSNLAETTNKNAQAITTKYTKKCVQKAISKYRQLYELSPKKINWQVFKNNEPSPLDSLTDRQNNILTNPKDIAKEIHIQQTTSNRPTVPTCYYQPDHHNHCTCAVRQYP
jgi:hypothetical protein